MIKKLKRRYFITNMALLSCTLIVALTTMFFAIYHAQVQSSYTVMEEMLKEQSAHDKDEKRPAVPNRNSSNAAGIVPLSNVIPLSENPYQDGYNPYWGGDQQDNGGQYQGDPNQGDPYGGIDWSNPYSNPYTNPYWQSWWWWWYTHQSQPPYWGSIPDNGDGQNGDQNGGESPWGDPWSYGWGWNYDWQNPQPDDGGRGAETDHGQNVDQGQYSEPQPDYDVHPEPFDDPQPIEEEPIDDEPDTGSPPEAPQTDSAQTETAPTSTAAKAVSTSRSTTASKAVTSAATEPAAVVEESEPEYTTQLVPVDEGQYVPDAFIAQIDENGNIASYAGNDSDDGARFELLHAAVRKIGNRGAGAGTLHIGDAYFRYLYQPDDAGNYQLVLLSRSLELSTLSRLIFIFLFVLAVGLICMFGLSMMLANWTVTPIAAAWEKQKQFVADASHELKTPLAVISANTEVILSNPAQSVAAQSKWLAYIQSETMRMSKLISNLLSVARMDNKETAAHAEPLPLSETISNVCLVFEPIVYENGKSMNTAIQRHVTIRADEDNVKQLMSILLDNAVLHSVPKAQINVTLSQDPQKKIRLTVSNTAKDIPQEQLSHLFERFYRVDTEGSPNGSGLGLSIAKSIVNQMGGTLNVTSENQLVTFIAEFP